MITRRFVVSFLLLVLASCTNAVEQHESSARTELQPSLSAPSATPMQLENDRICRKAYGIDCHAIPHLLGPLNADALGEDRACIREGVAERVNGEWVHDNKYQNPETGERYGDACIVVSL